MATKTRRIRQARELLRKARGQAHDAAVDSWEPAQPAECVTKCFYAFENALTAAATVLGEEFTTSHQEKAELAEQLAKERRLQTDISEKLVELNDLRKDVQYGSPGEELANTDLEGLLMELEAFLDEVEAVINRVESD
jgi:hypothetical protein